MLKCFKASVTKTVEFFRALWKSSLPALCTSSHDLTAKSGGFANNLLAKNFEKSITDFCFSMRVIMPVFENLPGCLMEQAGQKSVLFFSKFQGNSVPPYQKNAVLFQYLHLNKFEKFQKF